MTRSLPAFLCLFLTPLFVGCILENGGGGGGSPDSGGSPIPLATPPDGGPDLSGDDAYTPPFPPSGSPDGGFADDTSLPSTEGGVGAGYCQDMGDTDQLTGCGSLCAPQSVCVARPGPTGLEYQGCAMVPPSCGEHPNCACAACACGSKTCVDVAPGLIECQ